MGSDKRFDYSVLGDSVNLAARLEGQSKNYGVDIVIGEETQKTMNDWATIELDLIAVKGKAEAVRIFALIGNEEYKMKPEFQRLYEANSKMLIAYRNKEWDEADKLIDETKKLADSVNIEIETLNILYKERIDEYRQNPPPEDWDGVFVATSK